jgi:hypothetical protein
MKGVLHPLYLYKYDPLQAIYYNSLNMQGVHIIHQLSIVISFNN